MSAAAAAGGESRFAMSGDVRIVTERLGGSPLSLLAQDDGAPALFPRRPATVEAWRERAGQVRADGRHAWLDSLGEAFGPASGNAADRLARVAGGHGVVVTTGQQPGLFGGPVYTWTKALSARALADAIESATGIPTAPVFWAATDDSDLAEAAGTVLSGRAGAERIALDVSAPDGTRMADIPLPDMAALLARLEAACGSVADARPLELARQAWRAPNTIGGAYVALLRGILEPLGIAVLDASHPAVSRTAHPVLLRALHERERVAAALAARGRAIRAAGFQPQVTEMDGLTLVFARRDGQRARVSRAHAAVTAASAAPGTLSPNVLLRPVVERALLPTVAYVAGPGELAYFAQVPAVADALSLAQPIGVPRWSASVIEPDVQAVLDRLGLQVEDLADPHAVETRLAREAWPEPVARAMERLRRDIGDGMAGVRDAVREAGGLAAPPVLEGAARGLEWRLARLERRITAAIKRREQALVRDVRFARGALFPDGARQERVLNLLPLLSRHGLGLLDRMLIEAGAHAGALVGAAAAGRATP